MTKLDGGKEVSIKVVKKKKKEIFDKYFYLHNEYHSLEYYYSNDEENCKIRYDKKRFCE